MKSHYKILFASAFLLVAISLSVYAQAPLSDNMPASGVLGQANFITNTANTGGISASTLFTPRGITVDPTTGKIFVADYDNRRVLRWSSAAKMANGSAAEAVLGQPDFVTNTTNTGGVSAASMNRPYSVYVDAAGRLWVADLSNARVVRFDNASTIGNFAPANKVLGQPDFTTITINTGGISASTMNRPISVYGDASGNLYVSDRDNRRVMRFNNAAAKDNGDPADAVLGQPDFVTNTAGLTASKLGNRAWGVFADAGGRLWVADRDNHRVLRFDNAAAKTTGAAADAVLGQANFTSNVFALSQSGLGDPKGVFMDGRGRLYVSDEGNNRVKVYNNAATLSFAANADNVLGQPDFVTSTLLNPPTASSLNFSEHLWVDNSSNQIWIVDNFNNRILRFDVQIGATTAVKEDLLYTERPVEYSLLQNYPNPFNPSTTITFALKNTEYATVTIYNLLGQAVATLFRGVANANDRYSLSFDGTNRPSGVYFYTLRSASSNAAKKMILMK